MDRYGIGLNVALFAVVVAAVVLLSWSATRDTHKKMLMECALHGKFELMDGGTIKCEVMKKEKT